MDFENYELNPVQRSLGMKFWEHFLNFDKMPNNIQEEFIQEIKYRIQKDFGDNNMKNNDLKVFLCEGIGISRPTVNSMVNGEWKFRGIIKNEYKSWVIKLALCFGKDKFDIINLISLAGISLNIASPEGKLIYMLMEILQDDDELILIEKIDLINYIIKEAEFDGTIVPGSLGSPKKYI